MKGSRPNIYHPHRDPFYDSEQIVAGPSRIATYPADSLRLADEPLASGSQSRFGAGPDEHYLSVPPEQHSQEPITPGHPTSSATHRRRDSIYARFRGKRRKKIGWLASGKAIVMYSWLNILLVFVPIAWAVDLTREETGVRHSVIFGLCFLAIVPLSKLLEYGGEQLALYCGPDLGDLIVVTLSNAVEAALASILLSKCELKLCQSTIIGVVLLRLLLIPGTSFITGGVHVAAQELHPHLTQLNHTLLTIGSLTLLLPVAYFAALDKSPLEDTSSSSQELVNDSVRGQFLKVSRGLAVVLLTVYVCSRFFLHAGGEDKQLHLRQDAPAELREKAEHMAEEEPEVNPWACIIMLLIAVVLMAVTAEFLVGSIEPMRRRLHIQEEWFGLILIPIVSFSADGVLSTVFYIRYMFKSYFGTPYNHGTVAQARAIDLSIQFMIFWMPLLILIGWFTHKPFSMLFDMFEIAILLGACFLVNYVTADSKTNWAEGAMMVAFYVMIAVTAWFYPGQAEIDVMLSCTTIDVAIAEHQPWGLGGYNPATAHGGGEQPESVPGGLEPVKEPPTETDPLNEPAAAAMALPTLAVPKGNGGLNTDDTLEDPMI